MLADSTNGIRPHPFAVARAAGLHTSRIDGSELRYNQEDVLLPDRLVCRPELADAIIAFVQEAGETVNIRDVVADRR